MQSPVYSMEYEATNTHNKYFDIGESKNTKTTQNKLLYEGSHSDIHTEHIKFSMQAEQLNILSDIITLVTAKDKEHLT